MDKFIIKRKKDSNQNNSRSVEISCDTETENIVSNETIENVSNEVDSEQSSSNSTLRK